MTVSLEINYEALALNVMLVATIVGVWALARIIRLERKQSRASRFNWSIGMPVNKQDRRKQNIMLDIKLTNEQKIEVRVNPVTATGKAAALDGPVKFSVQSGDCSIEAIDESAVFIVSSDSPGDSVIIVEADADLGEGVELIQDLIKVSVEGARAASLGLSVGNPVAK